MQNTKAALSHIEHWTTHSKKFEEYAKNKQLLVLARLANFNGWEVPPVLLSGDPKLIGQ